MSAEEEATRLRAAMNNAYFDGPSVVVSGLGGSLHWDADTRALIHSDAVATALVATNVDPTFVEWVMEAWAFAPLAPDIRALIDDLGDYLLASPAPSGPVQEADRAALITRIDDVMRESR